MRTCRYLLCGKSLILNHQFRILWLFEKNSIQIVTSLERIRLNHLHCCRNMNFLQETIELKTV